MLKPGYNLPAWHGDPHERRGTFRRHAAAAAPRFLHHILRRGHAAGARDRSDLARARAGLRGRARAHARERAAAARDRAVSFPSAEGVRRDGASVRRAGRHRGRDRARLSVDRVERRQSRMPSLDPRLLRSANAARGLGRQPRHADRVLDRARGRARAQGRRRLHRQRALAVLVGRRQFATGTCSPRRCSTATRPVDSRLCMVPKSDYRIVDTWDAMGMGATGSKDVAATERIRARSPRACAEGLPRRLRVIRAPR